MARTRATPRDAVEAALAATRASKRIAFVRACSAADAGSWFELVEHVVALANSGGGAVVVGVERNGTPSGEEPAELLAAGAEPIRRRVADHTGEHFDDIEVRDVQREGRPIAVVVVGARTGSPLLFEKPGAYADGAGRLVARFGRGTVYFRHGARSEPAAARDLARFAAAEAARTRRELLLHVRKVLAAPAGSEVILVPPRSGPAAAIERFRVVDDPDAPALARTDFDLTHPFRQTELLATINERAGRHAAGPYEIQCVRRVHGIDARAEFFHRPKFGSPQYSNAFVAWLLAELARDPDFFEKAKDADRQRGDTETGPRAVEHGR